ncbi:hypothetical protein RHGRI_010270 [Rhododendron griersonianum]|uniref:Uncharacterized protein n=1 Tax=Rhododendron griersonianum TaxID=479676 RepID=A0AAV6KHU3_9ERIC|nr:hypothetical protein RHGRI_010270 [Rhododendron griersonianum]
MKDLTVPKVTRIKALTEICAEAKSSNITRNFLCKALPSLITQRHKVHICKALPSLIT